MIEIYGELRNIIDCKERGTVFIVQSNQEMHDLYATKHFSEMVLPDAFWQYRVKIYLNILAKLRFLRY